jgi:hypothetical protein
LSLWKASKRLSSRITTPEAVERELVLWLVSMDAGDEPTRQVSIALPFAASAAFSTWSRLLLLRILIALAFAAQLKSS